MSTKDTVVPLRVRGRHGANGLQLRGHALVHFDRIAVTEGGGHLGRDAAQDQSVGVDVEGEELERLSLRALAEIHRDGRLAVGAGAQAAQVVGGDGRAVVPGEQGGVVGAGVPLVEGRAYAARRP